MPEPRLVHRPDPGPHVPEVGDVDPVRDRGEALSPGDRDECIREPLAAEVAAVRRVLPVFFRSEFGGVDDAQRDADFRGVCRCGLDLPPREGLRVREDRKRIIANRVEHDLRDEAGIDAAGVRHEDAPAPRRDGTDRVVLPLEPLVHRTWNVASLK